jgi:5-methylcytosine-specific restriction endonuclease McrA
MVPSKQSKKDVSTPHNEVRVDHIHPKKDGGDGAPPNGQAICSTCNLEKGAIAE